MRPSSLIVTAFLLCSSAFLSAAENRLHHFSAGHVLWTVGSDGSTRALHLSSSDHNWSVGASAPVPPTPLGRVTIGTKDYPLTTLRAVPQETDVFEATYGESGVTARLRISPEADAIIVELLTLSGPRPTRLQLVSVPVSIEENVGSKLVVRWNTEAAFCLVPLSDRIEARSDGGALTAILHAEFGFEGQKVALLGTKPSDFYAAIEAIERRFGLPCPTLDGQWAKTSEDARTSYFFFDLKPDNVKECIRLAKLGGFKYILIYTTTWSWSRGTYSLHPKNYPGGESQLKAVVDECHAAGLKVGIHTLCSFVSKQDPLVRPKPDPRLLKDASNVLATDIDASIKTIAAASPLIGFSAERARRGQRGGLSIQIDDEIITYTALDAPNGTVLLNCKRGDFGTHAAPHQRGATIHHLAELASSFLADLRTDLMGEISERIAGLVNRCGLDMIYIDGGNGGRAISPEWYWLGQQQNDIFRRVNREILIQGNAMTPWTWHWTTRGVCDDYSSLEPNAYLDYHKMLRYHEHTRNFMPTELGWWGFHADRADHPATTREEIEYHAVRMLALDAPISLETNHATLQQHGRAEELLALLGRYERHRLGRTVPAPLREKLRTGVWKLHEDESSRAFVPVTITQRRIHSSESLELPSADTPQPLRFRLRVEPELKSMGDAANVSLFAPPTPFALRPPTHKDILPGLLAHRVAYTKSSGVDDVYLVQANDDDIALRRSVGLNLMKKRALAVRLRVSGQPPAGSPPPVLNLQLESITVTFRDHYIDLDFEGERVVILPANDFARLMREFHDVDAHYLPKSAGYTFNYASVAALNLRWMRAPAPTQSVEILNVEALAEVHSPAAAATLSLNHATITLPSGLRPGDTLEWPGAGPLITYDPNGHKRSETMVPVAVARPTTATPLQLDSAQPLTVTMAVETWGEPLSF